MPEYSFAEFMRDVLREVVEILKTEQRISAKINALFGLVTAFLIFALFVPSELHEIVSAVQTIRGKAVDETSAAGLVAAIISLLLYFLACVWIINRPAAGAGRPGPRGPRHA
jgi:hypothetical protein